jgi:hypothetical protein
MRILNELLERLPTEGEGICTTMGKGIQITFPNKMTVSIQWGRYNYCSNYINAPATGGEPLEQNFLDGATRSETVEVAVWNKHNHWMLFGESTVQGYVTMTELVEILVKVALLNEDTLKGFKPKGY